MYQNANQISEFRNPTPALATVGVILIVIGVVALLFIALEVLSVYWEPDANAFVTYIKDALTDSELASIGEQEVTIGEGGAIGAAFVLFGLFASVGAGIGFALVRAGTQLVSPYFQLKMTDTKRKLQEYLGRMDKK